MDIRSLWSEWEVRVLVLTSLFIQALLILTASIRKHTASKRIIGFLIWSCYLLADWIATLALGVIAKNLALIKNSDGGGGGDELKVLWAPFLLLHLGGPDNITAFSLEDNELWLRHLLGLLFQVGTAFYIFFSSFPHQQYKLSVVTILILMGGIIKYVERTLALMNASRDQFRKSMVTDPDPGPDYAKLMEEYSLQRDAGFYTNISTRNEKAESQLMPSVQDQDNEEDQNNNDQDRGRRLMDEIELIWKAHHFFQIFKRLIVDLILTFHDRNESQFLFMKKSWKEAYKVIEIELGFLYEVLHTKASVVHTLKGWILRFISVSSIIAASIIFFDFIDHDQDRWIDVTITYVLLSGAIALEFWSFIRLLFTDWTLVWMKKKNLNPRLIRFVFKLGLLYRRRSPNNRSRLSNYMAQYNLIQFCLNDQPFFWGKVMEVIHVKDIFDNRWHRKYTRISKELKEFVFEDLRGKVDQLIEDFRTLRGQSALEMIDSSDEVLENSISKAEFDESILLWHIATDICYYMDGVGHPEQVRSNQKISRDISNYMLYLLVSLPSMLTAGIGQIRFGDTCAEAKRFFHKRSETGTNNEEEACKNLHEVDTEVPPVQVKGDRSKSVLFEAVRVAKSLLKQEPDVKKRWVVIRLVWLEMLCYAASRCRGYYHARTLATGGEFLTIVCFLMAHLGIGEQYRVNQGHAQAEVVPYFIPL